MKSVIRQNTIGVFLSMLLSITLSAQYYTEVNPFTRNLDKDNYRPGTLPGQIDVNSLGESTYEIPLLIPPGTAGMQPSLSIVYNSKNPDGILGIGWAIEGLSEIHRIPKNHYHDGMIDGVDLQSNDKFALDSNRLVLTSQHTYGANGSEYRTEIESFSKITAYGTAGTGPSYFIVETKGGLTLEYGNTSDSKVEGYGSSTVYIWKLNKVTDQNGNTMEYTYNENSGESYISEINYTKNTSAGLNSYYNNISFTYYASARTDNNTIYPAGKQVPFTKLLKSIRIETEGDTLVREYGFKYVLDTYTHLNQITVMGADSNEFNPTIIGWGDSQTQFDPYYNVLNNGKKNNFYFGDFNGDGRTDILATERKTTFTTSDKWKLYYKSPSGTGFSFCNEGSLNSNFKEFVVADADGNGKDDIFWRDKVTTYYQCNPHPCDGGDDPPAMMMNLSTGIILSYVPPPPGDTCWDMCYYQTEKFLFYTGSDSTLTRGSTSYDITPGQTNLKLFPVELDGNGKSDFLLLTSSNNFYSIRGVTLSSNPNFNTPDDIRVIDFNGDGKQELLVQKGSVATIYTWNPTITQFTSLYTSSSWPNNYNKVFTGDFNGDKKDDILYWNSSWYLKLSTGSDLISSSAPSLRSYDPSYSTLDNNYYIGDLNGDGKDDILEVYKYSTTSRQTAFYSTGGGDFTSEINSYSKSDINQDYFTVGDFNGDNQDDIFYYDYSSMANYVSTCYFHPNEIKHLVHKITNGLNSKAEITYNRLNNSSGLYSPGDDAVFPLRDFNNGYYAVSKVEQFNDYIDTLSVEYSYSEAIYHTQGKKFRGFLETNSQTSDNYKTINTYEVNPTYFNRSKKAYGLYFILGDTLMHDLRFSNQVLHYGNNRIFPYTGRVDTWDNLNKTITSTENIFDNDGNLTETETKYRNQDSTLVATKNLTHTFSTYGNWGINNKVTKTSLSSIYSGESEYKREISYGYDSNGNLTTEIADTGKTKAVTTSYLINSFGVVYQKTISATGLTSRTESYDFDIKKRFITEITNPAGNDVSMQYYPGTGALKSVVDVNGNVTKYLIDGFGRSKGMITPLSDTISSSVIWDIEEIGGDEFLWGVESFGPNVPITYKWFDADGREKNSSIYYALWGTGFNKEYDASGKLSMESTLYYQGGLSDSLSVTTYGYDNFSRLSHMQSDNVWTLILRNGRTSTTYLPGGGNETRISTINALGDVVSIKENFDNDLTTTYSYHSSGQVKQTVSAGNTVTIAYNEYGRADSITKPNSGTEKYTYNAFGELTRQIDAKGDTTSFAYDNLGRITNTSATEGTTTYSYVTSGDGLQQISSITGPNNISYSYGYDNIGRIDTLIKTIPGDQTFVISYTYDNHGNIDEITYPGDFKIKNIYNSKGLLTEIQDIEENTIWKLNSLTKKGQPLSYDLGTGSLSATFAYDSLGYLTSKTIGDWDQYYTFNPYSGDLMERGYEGPDTSLYESFTYDKLHRLLTVANTGLDSLIMTYQDNGNISTKSDAGTYSYDASKVNALIGITDNEGTIPECAQEIIYNSFNKVTAIYEDNDTLELVYGPDMQRAKTRYYENSTLQKTMYYFGNYELEITPTDTIQRYYISSPYGLVALKVKDSSTDSTYFVGTDHLGSIIALYRNDGSVKEQYSFDAWGRRRNPTDWTYDNIPEPTLTKRGYTGHEHLDEFNLINMNGRVYDQVVGRFLSVDPVIQSPYFTQSYNSYSYVFNNPLKFTDPSGNVVYFYGPEGAESNAWNTYEHKTLEEMNNELFGDEILRDIENARLKLQGGSNGNVKVVFLKDALTGELKPFLVPDFGGNQDNGGDYLVYQASFALGNKYRTEGNLVWYNSKNEIVLSIPSVSGAMNKQAYTIPEGAWVATFINFVKDPLYTKDDVSFRISLGPDRYDSLRGRFTSDLRIHPARSPGTYGCIGLRGTKEDLLDFINRFENYVNGNGFMNVFVEYY